MTTSFGQTICTMIYDQMYNILDLDVLIKNITILLQFINLYKP